MNMGAAGDREPVRSLATTRELLDRAQELVWLGKFAREDNDMRTLAGYRKQVLQSLDPQDHERFVALLAWVAAVCLGELGEDAGDVIMQRIETMPLPED